MCPFDDVIMTQQFSFEKTYLMTASANVGHSVHDPVKNSICVITIHSTHKRSFFFLLNLIVLTALCAGRRGLNLLTAVRPVELAHNSPMPYLIISGVTKPSFKLGHGCQCEHVSITVTTKWARWHVKSPASRLFTQAFIQAHIKEIIQAPRHTGLCAGNSPVTGEFTAQVASNAEKVSTWWRHHGHSELNLSKSISCDKHAEETRGIYERKRVKK